MSFLDTKSAWIPRGTAEVQIIPIEMGLIHVKTLAKSSATLKKAVLKVRILDAGSAMVFQCWKIHCENIP